MRVALIGSHQANVDGGSPAPDDVTPLGTALAARGVDVVGYSCQPGAVEVGYPVVHLPSTTAAQEASSAAGLAPIVGEFATFLSAEWDGDPPDVVSAASWIHGVAAQLAADRHGIPTVLSLPQLAHTVQRRQGRPVDEGPQARFERLLARAAQRVVVSCTDDLTVLLAFGCARRRLSVLPQAVDVEHFTSVGPAAPRGSEQRIVTVARELLPHKGIEDLIRTLPRLPAAELVVVGGPDRHRLDWDAGACRLRSLALDLNVSDRLHLTGHVAWAKLPPILRSADVFAASSWYEPFGLPVVEAMACGVPVVASAAGGMLDTVVHEVTGLLVPARDPAKLAKALDAVLRAGALRNGMGLAGRVRARSRYCWDRVAAEANTTYERAVHEAAGRGVVGSARGDVA